MMPILVNGDDMKSETKAKACHSQLQAAQHDSVMGSLASWLLMTSTMTPQSAFCICSRKWKAKLIIPIFLGLKPVRQFNPNF